MKKKPVIGICVALAAALSIGGIIYARKGRGGADVNVYPVSLLAQAFWGEGSSSEGQIYTDLAQDIVLSGQETVEEVYVHEGDTVKIGDPLIAYDKTAMELDLEDKRLAAEQIKVNIDKAKRKLNELYNLEPGKKPSEEPYPGGGLGRLEINDRTLLAEGNTVDKLDYSTVFESIGSRNVVRCTESTVVTKEFIYLIAGYDETGASIVNTPAEVVLYIDGHNEKILLDGNDIALPASDAADTTIKKFILSGGTFSEPEEPETETETETESESEIETETEVQGHTQEEINQMIAAALKEISEYQLQLKQAELDYTKAMRTKDNAIVTATVNGTVTSVKEVDEALSSGEPVISVRGASGIYVKGYLSEFDLGTTKVGSEVQITNWENGQNYIGKIVSISDYPIKEQIWGGGNTNVSRYTFSACIEEAEGLKNGTYVDVKIGASSDTQQESSALFINEMFIRWDNSQAYVYAAGENNKLVRRNISTGKVSYGQEYEIRSGLSMDDAIAFPYGKNVKEGARTVRKETIEALYEGFQ